ncbi:Cupin domain protein [Candidatus Methylomirabilis lanthanidiphila]|uniref:Cupin domain protein n=1 Tax=Candidatus Methylomirabilis lanthanidiphila TaxID=2211376 RepID=A0A564ZGQ8_9BACT|nr:cupin domain-containing protein [Candidatus Methylomirabilis lanthanidiphila]VUZ84087.1 Cupin domain protein [Candidatus Methylomirabilis lanthanidiphila]
MKRTGLLLTLTLTVGIALGVIGTQTVDAQQEPMKRTVLIRTDLAGIQGKEAILVLVEFAPGAVTASHYHSGEELAYLLEGTVSMEAQGKSPITFKPGDTFHLAPKQVHRVKNLSATTPAKALTFTIAEKGQPDTVPVK